MDIFECETDGVATCLLLFDDVLSYQKGKQMCYLVVECLGPCVLSGYIMKWVEDVKCDVC